MAFLNEIAVNANSFSKYVSGGQIDTQLHNFFALISNPVVSGYNITYIGVTDIDETYCNLCQNGEALDPIVGRASGNQTLGASISGRDKNGPFQVNLTICENAMDIHQE